MNDEILKSFNPIYTTFLLWQTTHVYIHSTYSEFGEPLTANVTDFWTKFRSYRFAIRTLAAGFHGVVFLDEGVYDVEGCSLRGMREAFTATAVTASSWRETRVSVM